VTRHIYEIARLAHDIAGGIVATMPFQGDLESGEVGRYVKKYSAGAKGVPVEDRMKILRLIENMRGGDCPGRIHAWRRVSSDAKGHVWSAGQP
jgi:4-hydroxybutyryl-CoA dehydratase/vinylacetyl-CoA-Delta-isomerase